MVLDFGLTVMLVPSLLLNLRKWTLQMRLLQNSVDTGYMIAPQVMSLVTKKTIVLAPLSDLIRIILRNLPTRLYMSLKESEEIF